MPEDLVVTPWEVRGHVDYDCLVQRFGTRKVDDQTMRAVHAIMM